jgi:hypothetical protein
MPASRNLVVLVLAGLVVSCTESPTGEVEAADLDIGLEPAALPDFPPAPPNTTCVLIQRGTLGAVQDTDIGLGNGANWVGGTYSYTWTGAGPWPNLHHSLYQFDLSVLGPNQEIKLAVFSTYVSWTSASSAVRAHRITTPWDELTATWASFTNNGSVSPWDPGVLGSFDPYDTGFRSIELTGIAQDWYTGAVANNGLILEENPAQIHNYLSSEHQVVENRPSLYVCSCPGISAACSSNDQCCSGSCIDGLCTTDPAAACVGLEDFDQNGNPKACDPNNPCCSGLHCIDNTCQPAEFLTGGVCAITGQPCRHNDDVAPVWCCWDRQCMNTDENGNGFCE